MNDQDEIEDWLEKNGISARETAETFSEYGFSTAELETIRNDLGTEIFCTRYSLAGKSNRFTTSDQRPGRCICPHFHAGDFH